MKLSMEQENAIDLCCDFAELIVGVTGGAGVGKTLVLGNVHRELSRLERSVVLCAPTGRAAKRITELTGVPAKTVHRLLEFPLPWEDGEKTQPRRDRTNPLEHDVVIVDEASMISPFLYRSLINALPRGGVIRFFGDNNQLPPVEEGKPPFITILKERPSVELTYNYRSGDALIDNSRRILRGQFPQRCPQFEILYSENPIKMLLEFATSDFMEGEHQIITPTRRGKSGSLRMNPSLQIKFNSKGPMLQLNRFDKQEAKLTIRAGDKFIWINNDYNLDLMNGEIGYVDWVDPDAGDLHLVTPERSINVPPRMRTYDAKKGTVVTYDPRKQIELGYAVTTHKSQGSEFDTVVYCMSKGQAYLLNKRNFYTAVTRAKHQVILITDRRSMSLSMRPYDV